MGIYSFQCIVKDEQIPSIMKLLDVYSSKAGRYGFQACIEASGPSVDGTREAVITLKMDDEVIAARKTGPKPVSTSLSAEEMDGLRRQGMGAAEIAARAGISRATYFRRMAEYDEKMKGKQ